MSPPAPPAPGAAPPAAGEVPLVLLLHGDEQLRLREAEEQAIREALDGDASGFNLAVFQAGEGEVLGRLLDLVRTMPMMARRRVVVLREIDRAPVALQDALLDYLEHPSPSTCLILSGVKLPEAAEKVNRGLRIRNRVEKVGRVLRFDAKQEDPVAFAEERARRAGCRLARDAATLLVELSGRDLGRLAMEIEKASDFLGGEGTIDTAVVSQTCSVVGEAEIWALTGALVRRDADQALAAMHRLLEDGSAPHYLLAMVTWQVRQLLSLQDCLRRGLEPKEAGLSMNWRAQQEAERALRARPLVEASLLSRLSRANRQFNRARAGDRRVFEGLVLELVAR